LVWRNIDFAVGRRIKKKRQLIAALLLPNQHKRCRLWIVLAGQRADSPFNRKERMVL
jgi:hypothetical protein